MSFIKLTNFAFNSDTGEFLIKIHDTSLFVDDTKIHCVGLSQTTIIPKIKIGDVEKKEKIVFKFTLLLLEYGFRISVKETPEEIINLIQQMKTKHANNIKINK